MRANRVTSRLKIIISSDRGSANGPTYLDMAAVALDREETEHMLPREVRLLEMPTTENPRRVVGKAEETSDGPIGQPTDPLERAGHSRGDPPRT